ncbi:helix-turn-helix domain-containing protein [sulfur-oxidizing endosymbiont of Gigantopelta aegis]|uniref:helix-turn-helix domain-containing protein n=1 Tax=sulfur-oxidizing endosymbiont of Gigantopelta aegis TaxID=2794934 RepID=UPI0018DE9CE8|nr:helix-turn-helix domain-containing protein [sulfur-oxidizing endosymbiont of Gigantopelta aegis]
MHTSSPSLRDLHLQDASEQQAAQDWLAWENHQLKPGHYKGRLRELHLDSLSIVEENQNQAAHKHGLMEKNLCTISYIRPNTEKNRFSEHSIDENELYFLPSNTEFDVQIEANVETIYFRFEQSRVQERASVLCPKSWEKPPTDLMLFKAPLQKQLDCFVRHLFSTQSILLEKYSVDNKKSLDQIIMDQVLLTLDFENNPGKNATGLIARRRAFHVVGRAREYIITAHNNQLCPSIIDICHEIKVSQRTLQYSFKILLGLTPINYLRILRLNWARRQLKHPVSNDTTVTDIAMRWGFWHLGKFSNCYMTMFGELPSTTLKQAYR